MKALITGATSGIGKAIAQEMSRRGISLILTGRNEEALLRMQETLPVHTEIIALDLAENQAPFTLYEFCRDKHVDILVNNAANVGLKDGRVDELTLEMWDAIFQSDIRGTFFATKCVLPYMEKIGGGSIINIGSMASCLGDLGSTAYACAKAGVDKLTQYTALQYGKQNIRCNCVRPGLIVTPQNEAYVPQALKDIFLSNIMVNRYGCPEDIGHMCVYLASDESSYVTGQIINVDGGLNSHVSTVAQFREMKSRTW